MCLFLAVVGNHLIFTAGVGFSFRAKREYSRTHTQGKEKRGSACSRAAAADIRPKGEENHSGA